MKKTPAVVTPLDDHMGLDIARSLGRRNIPVFGIDALNDNSRPGRYSKYCQFVQSPSPDEASGENFIQLLLEFGKNHREKPVLFPLSDETALLCSEHRKALLEFYAFTMPPHETMVKLATKDGLRSMAEKYDLPAPLTFRTNKHQSIENISEQITYPALLKPTESACWHDPKIASLLQPGLLGGRAKVMLCESPAQLVEQYNTLAEYDDRLIVQEVIPGEDSRLVYFSFYLNSSSQPLGIFAGRKIRVIPKGFGSASYVQSLYDPALINTGLSFLEECKYQGLGGIEFKKDPRDEKYKLVEFNTRFGMWDGLGVQCGVDLPYIAYCDTLNIPVDPQLTYEEDVLWIDFQRDFRAALEYLQAGELSFMEWLTSLRGNKMWAIYDRDDWQPGIVFTLILIKKMFSRMK